MTERPIRVRALYSLYPPTRLHSEVHLDLYEKFVAEFGEAKSVAVRGSHFHDGQKLSIRAIECSRSLQKRLFSRSPFGLRTRHLIEFYGTFAFPGILKYHVEGDAGGGVSITNEQLPNFWLDDLPGYLDVTIQSYLCALLIAFSGSVHTTHNIWFAGDQEHRFSRRYVSSIPWALDFLRQNSVQSPKDIGCDSAVEWVFAQSGMFDGHSNTPAARALNYFTRLFVPDFREDELSNTVWALAGIEALLVEGGRSSVGQLREKLNAILGNSQNSVWLTKMTDLLYQYRSKMVHGNRQIKSAFRKDEGIESEKRFDEEINSENFAVGILTVLLQHVIVQKRSRFEFKTVLSE